MSFSHSCGHDFSFSLLNVIQAMDDHAGPYYVKIFLLYLIFKVFIVMFIFIVFSGFNKMIVQLSVMLLRYLFIYIY